MKKLFILTILIFAGTFSFAQVTSSHNSDTIRKTGVYDPDAPPPPDTMYVPTNGAPAPEKVFSYAEVAPECPGGFQQFLVKNVRYPQMEKEAGKRGTVYVSFIVEKDGSVTNVRVVKEVPGAPGFSKEALRVMTLSPKWSPGQMNGQPVRVEVTEPIRFNLQ